MVLTHCLLGLPGARMGSRKIQGMAEAVPDYPNVRSEGSREPIPHLDVEVAGAGVFTHAPDLVFFFF